MDPYTLKKIMPALVAMAIMSLIATAMPLPHGIDGTIYDLDGITKAGDVHFKIENTATKQVISGTTGTGHYSAAINGIDSDMIIVTAWNEKNNSTREVALNGVLHNVDLLLDMGAGGQIYKEYSEAETIEPANEESWQEPPENIKVSVGNARVIIIQERPEGTERIKKKVYRYMRIDGQSRPATITFEVPKKWLIDHKIGKNEIIMKRHTSAWETLNTKIKMETEQTVEYESETPGFSYFAITTETESKELPEPEPSSIPEPYKITGVIRDKQNNPLSIEYTIKNLNTSKEYKGKSIKGEYYALVYGEKGDAYSFQAGKTKYEFTPIENREKEQEMIVTATTAGRADAASILAGIAAIGAAIGVLAIKRRAE